MNPPPQEHQSDGEVTFKLRLNCLARKTSSTGTLTLPSFPSAVQDIKQAIQRSFSIPACVQTLSYHSIPLTSSSSTSSSSDLLGSSCRHMRSGDTLRVDYSCEADVEKIDEILGWVREVTSALQDKEVPFAVKEALILRGSRCSYESILAMEIFDWMDAKTYVNKIYFLECGGLEAVLALYNCVLLLRWETMFHVHMFIEIFCSHAFANFGETLYLRRMLGQRAAGLDVASCSLLRTRFNVGGDTDEVTVETMFTCGDEYSRYALKSVLSNSLHVICNLAELPAYQVAIASNSSIISQATAISLSGRFHPSISVLVSELFLCLAHSPDTHPYLADDSVVHTLCRVCTKWEQNRGPEKKEYLLFTALRCFTCMVFAQIALASPHLFSPPTMRSLATHMRDFLDEAQPSDIKEYEEEQLCVWSTLLPYLKLFYLPRKRTAPSIPKSKAPLRCRGLVSKEAAGNIRPGLPDLLLLPPSTAERVTSANGPVDKETGDITGSGGSGGGGDNMEERGGVAASCGEEVSECCDTVAAAESLRRASLRVVLFFLLTKVSRDCHCKVLLEEELVDFVTCLPWHVRDQEKEVCREEEEEEEEEGKERETTEQARRIVLELQSHVNVQPSRLSSLAKAVLARMHFGLEEVVSAHSPMELARQLHPVIL